MNNIPKVLLEQKAFFNSQKTKNVNYRVTLLKALKKEIVANEKAIYQALKKDFKKSEFESFLSEFALVISEIDLALKKIKKWSKPERVKSSILNFPSSDYIYKEPYGNVLIIAPWNYPFLLAISPLIMAIAAGNTVVLKPSELTTNTSNLITKIIKNVFSKEVAISIEGNAKTATALLAQKWDYIFFTGSVSVGKIVAKAASVHLTPVTLELGGKSPCIIDESTDLKLTSRRLVWGKLLNAGQTCIAPDYVIVNNKVKASLIECLKAEIQKMYGENPKASVDLPRIINKKNYNRLKHLLENETIIFGGQFDKSKNYIAPTLINEPSLESPVMKEEIFGPILPILTYDSLNDIEKIIWNFEKPLALYVFSKKSTFIKQILEKYSFGGGVVNDTLIHFGNQKLPFGGVGTSGIGRYHGKHGFETFSHKKSIIKRGTWIDPSLRYPPYKNKLNFIRKIFKFFG